MSSPWQNTFKVFAEESETTEKPVAAKKAGEEKKQQRPQTTGRQYENQQKQREPRLPGEPNLSAANQQTEGQVQEGDQSRGGYRGGRGGRGGFRGGRGGEYRGRGGEFRGGEFRGRGGEFRGRGRGGEFRGRGEYRGGRGRGGYRGRGGFGGQFVEGENQNFEGGAYATEAYEYQEENLEVGHVPRTSGQGESHGYTGTRNQYHPYDRHSGTGRGREGKKDGHGKGNWGDFRDDNKIEQTTLEGPVAGETEGEAVVVEGQENKEGAQEDAGEHTHAREHREEEEEEEDNTLTVAEFLNRKNEKRVNLPKREERKVEGMSNKKDIAKFERPKETAIEAAKQKGSEEYKMALQSEHGNLLGFIHEQDWRGDRGDRGGRGRGGRGRGFRGGRGGFRGGEGGYRGGRGGYRGGRQEVNPQFEGASPSNERPQQRYNQDRSSNKQELVLDEKSFPSLS